MEIKQEINTLLKKKMNRQDFIKHVAVGAVALMGGGALVRLAGSGDRSAASDAAYGGTAYGGDPSRGGRVA